MTEQGQGTEAILAQIVAHGVGLPVSRVMMTEFHTLAPHDPLSRAVEHVLSGCQQDFPVLDGGHITMAIAEAIRLGTAPAAIILAEADINLAVGAEVAATPVGSVAKTNTPVSLAARPKAAIAPSSGISTDESGAEILCHHLPSSSLVRRPAACFCLKLPRRKAVKCV